MHILKWFGWKETEFDESRRLFLRKGATIVLAPAVVPKAITYFFPLAKPAYGIAQGESLFFLPKDPLYSLIDSTTLESVRRSIIYDNFFATTPFLELLRR